MIVDMQTGKIRIAINKRTLEEVREAYIKAVDDGQDSFYYEGVELLVDYAKYLIQYMEMVLGKTGETQ